MNAMTDPMKATTVTPAAPSALPVMASVAVQREIAEVQGMILMARQFPRDQIAARDRVLMACARPELAEVALYQYSRGGTDITGPSIRMAEMIAQNWGNVQCGIRELEQRANESTVEAYALDLETITRSNKIFQVPHVRYTRAGGRQNLTDPRDVYESVASAGARRLRACILSIVPADLVDAAVHQVELTLRNKGDVTPERIEKLIERFAGFKVTREQIEKRIQRRLDAMTPQLLLQLGKIYNSLKDGMSKPGDWFEADAPSGESEPETGTAGAKAALAARKKKTATESPPPEAPGHPPDEGEGGFALDGDAPESPEEPQS